MVHHSANGRFTAADELFGVTSWSGDDRPGLMPRCHHRLRTIHQSRASRSLSGASGMSSSVAWT